MKYLSLILLCLAALSSKAQYMSSEFLSADLKNSTFELRGWDGILSEKDQVLMVNSWPIGKLIVHTDADTTKKDFVIFPARYVAKVNFEGLAIVSGNDIKDLPFKDNEPLTVTEDMAVLSMFMIPEKIDLPKAHELLISALKNNMSFAADMGEKDSKSQQELNLYSFQKAYANNAIGFHFMILEMDMMQIADEEFATLSDLELHRLSDNPKSNKMLKEGAIIAYVLPIPKSWNGDSQCSLLNTEYGILYSESFPSGLKNQRLGRAQLELFFNNLLKEKPRGLFSIKG